MPRPLKPVAGLALVFALAACSPGADVSPTPSFVTPSVTASAPPTPTPDMDALYAEAERVVRRATELEELAIQVGDVEYPAELEGLLADPYLTWSRVGLQQYRELGWKGPEGKNAILDLRPLAGVALDGSEVALEGCFDTRPVPAVDADGNVMSEGALFHRTYFFKHVGNGLRLFNATKGDKVDQCPFS